MRNTRWLSDVLPGGELYRPSLPRRPMPTRADDPKPPIADLSAAVDSLRRVLREVRRSRHATSAILGIGAAQLAVLQEVARSPGACISELADRVQTDRSAVSVIIGRLAERGLVVRDLSSADRRRATLRISSQGERLLRLAPRVPVPGLGRLSAAELRALARQLMRLARALGDDRPLPAEATGT